MNLNGLGWKVNFPLASVCIGLGLFLCEFGIVGSKYVHYLVPCREFCPGYVVSTTISDQPWNPDTELSVLFSMYIFAVIILFLGVSYCRLFC